MAIVESPLDSFRTYNFKTAARRDRLRSLGPLGEMIVNALSVTPMTPGDLVACLMSEPYSLAPTEENLQDILNIIKYRSLVDVDFEKDPENPLRIRTLLTL